jgi:hypothetical protein
MPLLLPSLPTCPAPFPVPWPSNVQDVISDSPTKTPRSMRPHGDLHPEEVVALRSGAVLLRNTILKSDHFPVNGPQPGGSASGARHSH